MIVLEVLKVAAIVAAVLVWFGWAPTICALKGRWTLFGVGFIGILLPFVGICWLVGALRLARPGSWWYRTRYTEERQAAAIVRHSTEAATELEVERRVAERLAATS